MMSMTLIVTSLRWASLGALVRTAMIGSLFLSSSEPPRRPPVIAAHFLGKGEQEDGLLPIDAQTNEQSPKTNYN